MYYTLSCPNCRNLQKMLDDVLPQYPDTFKFSKTLASAPVGMIKSMRLGIHSVPALVIDKKIAFRGVPAKQELINYLNQYKNGK